MGFGREREVSLTQQILKPWEGLARCPRAGTTGAKVCLAGQPCCFWRLLGPLLPQPHQAFISFWWRLSASALLPAWTAHQRSGPFAEGFTGCKVLGTH